MNQIRSFNGKTPKIDPTAFIHETAVIVGDVTIEAHVSVWPYAVIRGDGQLILIKAYANIQDHCMIHVSGSHKTTIEAYVTVGHRAIVHACHVKHDVIVGMGATLLDGSVIGEYSIVGANALVGANKHFEPHSLIVGMPAVRKREVTQADRDMIRNNALHYAAIKEYYRD